MEGRRSSQRLFFLWLMRGSQPRVPRVRVIPNAAGTGRESDCPPTRPGMPRGPLLVLGNSASLERQTHSAQLSDRNTVCRRDTPCSRIY